MPAARITAGGSSVMPTRSLLPSASRHSRTHTARTSAPRCGRAARVPILPLNLRLRRETRSGLMVSLVAAGPLLARPLLDGLDDLQVHVLEVRPSLDYVRDARAAFDERADKVRVRAQRVVGGD